jgi:hypothetical protein
MYAAALVPWIEPAHQPGHIDEPQGSVLEFAMEEFTNFRQFLPANAWELSDEASVLETNQGALIFLHQETLTDGSMRLQPLTLVYYAERDKDGDTGDRQPANAKSASPDSDVPIFIQAPDGGILETDRPINLARLEFGKPVSGRLLGEVTIHRPSTASSGEEDDSLWIVTRNLKVTETQIITPHQVEFRIGPHHGHGEDLEIDLVKKTKGSKRGKNSFGKIRNITLHRLDHVMLISDGGLLRRASGVADVDKSVVQTRTKKKTPIEIRSSGPFDFNMASWRATLIGDVRVTRTEDGFTDTLSCHRLTILFNRPTDDDNKMSFSKIIAEGLPNSPVVIDIRSQEIAGRGHKLTCYHDQRRILFEDREGAWFRHRETEIEVPVLDYFLDTENPRRLGNFDGKGAGVMRSLIERDGKDLSMVISWMNSVQVRPAENDGLRVISVFGRAKIQLEETGEFNARELHLFVREVPRDGVPERFRLTPDQLYAAGEVAFKSKRLTGNTNEVRVWFVPDEDVLPSPLGDLVAGPGPLESTEDRNDVAAHTKKALKIEDFDGPPIHVVGQRIHARVLQGRHPRIDDVTVLGDVHVTSPLGPDREPFDVHGDTLQLSQIQTNDPQIRVNGRPAQIKADGVDIRGDRIFVSGLKNDVWIYGAGELFAPSRRATPDRPLREGELVHVSWKKGLRFDGEVATIRDDVRVEGRRWLEKTGDVATFVARAPQIRLTLDRRIVFLDPPSRVEAETIATKSIQFDGPTKATSITRDPFGVQLSIDELDTRDLHFWPQTGELTTGPGWIKTLRYDSSMKPSPNGSKTQLMHIEVRFSQSIKGNLEKRDITFRGDVHTIVGPIGNWQQRLNPDVPNGLGKDGVEIFSQQLRGVEFQVNQDESHMEMIADGNVIVHNSQFSAYADRLSYNNSKDLLILKGIGPGRLARIESIFRGVSNEAEGRELHVWPKRKHVDWEGIQRVELGGFGSRKR